MMHCITRAPCPPCIPRTLPLHPCLRIPTIQLAATTSLARHSRAGPSPRARLNARPALGAESHSQLGYAMLPRCMVPACEARPWLPVPINVGVDDPRPSSPSAVALQMFLLAVSDMPACGVNQEDGGGVPRQARFE